MSKDREIKWEYWQEWVGTVTKDWAGGNGRENEDRFNELGEEGWELVNTHLVAGDSVVAWFKRRKASKFIRRER